MPTVYGPLDLVKNELRNAVAQNLGTAPAAPVKGLLYFNTADSTLYWYDGTQWIAAKGGAGAVPSDTVTTQAIGDTGVPGSSGLYARGDHKHGMPAFGAATLEQTFGTSAGNGVAVTVSRSDHTHGNPFHTAAAHSTIPLSTFTLPVGDINMGGFKLVNLGTPTNPGDAATKGYVDGVVNGLAWKDSCRAATTANITLSGTQTIDGVAVVVGDRVVVKNQTTGGENGIWVVAAGAWARGADADSETDLIGAAVFVNEGATNGDTAWVITNNAPITVGSSILVWAQFGAGASYTAGAGLTLAGATFDVGAGVGITVAADSVAVDQSVIASRSYVDTALAAYSRKFAAALTGTASPETVTHNLNTRDVLVQVLNGATPYTAVEVDWDATSVNAVTIRYNPNLGAGYRAVVLG